MRSLGINDVQLETVTLEAHSESAKALATGFIQGSPLSTALQERGASFDSVIESVTGALTQLGGATPFRSTMQAVVVTARAGAV